MEWKKGKSWLEDWWLKYSYLIWRDPLPLNSNYFMNFDEEICKPGTTQSLQAARVISKVLEFKRLVDENKVPNSIIYLKKKFLNLI